MYFTRICSQPGTCLAPRRDVGAAAADRTHRPATRHCPSRYSCPRRRGRSRLGTGGQPGDALVDGGTADAEQIGLVAETRSRLHGTAGAQVNRAGEFGYSYRRRSRGRFLGWNADETIQGSSFDHYLFCDNEACR